MKKLLPNQKIKASDIDWKKIADGDFIAKFSIENVAYCLRFEKMDTLYWWGAISMDGDEVWSDAFLGKICQTKKEIKQEILKELNLLHLSKSYK